MSMQSLVSEAQSLAGRLTSRADALGARVQQSVSALRARALLRGCERGAHIRADGLVRVVVGGRIVVGDHVYFSDGVIPAELLCHNGELLIGPHCRVDHGVSIEAHHRVFIGARCRLSPMVRIRDASGDRVAPVVIGDDVWFADGVTIEPGVTVGGGSLVLEGSVVDSDIPPDSLVAGDPAVWVPLEQGPTSARLGSAR